MKSLVAVSMPRSDVELIAGLQAVAIRHAALALRAVLVETDGGRHAWGKPYSADSYLPANVVVAVREALAKCEEFIS